MGEWEYFISGVTRDTSEADVIQHFSNFQVQIQFSLLRDSQGRSFGYGYAVSPQRINLSSITQLCEIKSSKITIAEVHKNDGLVAPANASDPSEASPPVNLSGICSGVSGSNHRCETRESRKRSRSPERLSSSVTVSQYVRSVPPPLSPVDSLPAAPPPPPPGPPPSQHHVVSPIPASVLDEYFVCIPSSILPPAYLSDPRVFASRLDSRQVGQLCIIDKFSLMSYGTVQIPVPLPPFPHLPYSQ